MLVKYESFSFWAVRLMFLSMVMLSLSARAKDCESLLNSTSPVNGYMKAEFRAYGGFRSDDAYDIKWLKKLTKKSVSIESLIQNLPMGLRRDYSLIAQSSSPQFASPISPRVILTNSDSTFLLTFSGEPKERGFGSLEGVVFNQALKSFIPFEVIFDGNQGRVVQNPNRCARCHGEVFRPIWDSYPFWPKAFGSESGLFEENENSLIKEWSKREQKLFKKFQSQSSKGRYAFLVEASNIKDLENINSALSHNLGRLRRLQVEKLLSQVIAEDPRLGSLVNLILRSISDETDPNYNMERFLTRRELGTYKRRIDEIVLQTEKVWLKTRKRKIESHFGLLKIELSDKLNFFNVDHVPVADFDLGLMSGPLFRHERNLPELKRNIQKFADLHFVWVMLLNRSMADLNMTLDPNEFPTFSGPIRSFWRSF